MDERDFAVPYTEPGLCVAMNSSGAMALVAYAPAGSLKTTPSVLLRTQLSEFAPRGEWNHVSLEVSGLATTIRLNEKIVGTVTLPLDVDVTTPSGGCVALGTGWNSAEFDNMTIAPAGGTSTTPTGSLVRGVFTTAATKAGTFVETPIHAAKGNSISSGRHEANVTTSNNNDTLWAGMAIRMGNHSAIVSALGRYALPGNRQQHRMRIVRYGTGVDVLSKAIIIDLGVDKADAVGFVWSTLEEAAVTLERDTTYLVVSEEHRGLDEDAFLSLDNSGDTANTGFGGFMEYAYVILAYCNCGLITA